PARPAGPARAAHLLRLALRRHQREIDLQVREARVVLDAGHQRREALGLAVEAIWEELAGGKDEASHGLGAELQEVRRAREDPAELGFGREVHDATIPVARDR